MSMQRAKKLKYKDPDQEKKIPQCRFMTLTLDEESILTTERAPDHQKSVQNKLWRMNEELKFLDFPCKIKIGKEKKNR